MLSMRLDLLFTLREFPVNMKDFQPVNRQIILLSILGCIYGEASLLIIRYFGTSIIFIECKYLCSVY